MLCLATALLGACSQLIGPPLPTPMPPEYLPTAIALTAQSEDDTAVFPGPAPLEATASPTPESASSWTVSAPPTPSETALPTIPSATPSRTAPARTPTPTPEIPNGEIQILNLGPLSRVTSPIHLSAYLRTGAGGRVTVELLGEDGRLLFREVKVIRSVLPGAMASLRMDVDFEIAAAAEAGRLQISTRDEYQRVIALDSVPLILLSMGDADILPARDTLAPLVIQQPRKKALIQGGTVLVSGLVRGSLDQPVMVRLLTAKGNEVGSRLANVDFSLPGEYGTFQVEVPYHIEKTTEVLLVVSQGQNAINDVIHLTSQLIMLSP